MPPLASKQPGGKSNQPRAQKARPSSNSKKKKTPLKATGSRASPQGLGGSADGPIWVSLTSPSPSEFGQEFKSNEFGSCNPLPKHILQFLDKNELKPFYVAADGNCFYRAATFGPNFSKHDLLRVAVARALTGSSSRLNLLGETVSAEQVEDIATGI